MTCNFCDGQCACHINPPCGFCETHIECEICRQLVCLDKVVELTDKTDGSKIRVCPVCEERGLIRC